jgi:hypothetical protein
MMHPNKAAAVMPLAGPAAVHIWAKLQKPTKNYIHKIREIAGSYLCLQ